MRLVPHVRDAVRARRAPVDRALSGRAYLSIAAVRHVPRSFDVLALDG